MPRRKYDRDAIIRLSKAGFTDEEIAEKLGYVNKSAPQQIMRIRLKYGIRRSGSGINANFENGKKSITDIVTTKSDLSNMSRSERVDFLKAKFQASARFRYMFDTISEEEKEVFQEEYFNVIQEIDDLTMTEEQGLFIAIYELVLALRAQSNRKKEEQHLEKCRNGKINPNDPSYITKVDSKYDKEYSDHLRAYNNSINDLKLSRKQRLDKAISKKSFLDFANELSEKAAQESVAEEIRKLNKRKDEELKRLIDEGLLLGYFKK